MADSDDDVDPVRDKLFKWNDSVLEGFLRARTEELASPPAAEEDPSSQSIEDRIDEERIAELQEARNYRREIVTFTKRVVAGLVAAATVFMGAYIVSQWGDIDPSVVIAYFTSVVVETIGVLYVISRYLFPDSGRSKPD